MYSPDKSALPLGPSTSTLTLCVNGSMTVAIIHITQSSPADKTAQASALCLPLPLPSTYCTTIPSLMIPLCSQLEVERVLDHAASASTRKFVPAGYSHPLSRQLFKMMSRLDGGDEESTRKRVRRPFVRVLYMCDPDSKPQVLHVSNAALRFASKAQDASSCSR